MPPVHHYVTVAPSPSQVNSKFSDSKPTSRYLPMVRQNLGPPQFRPVNQVAYRPRGSYVRPVTPSPVPPQYDGELREIVVMEDGRPKTVVAWVPNKK